MILGSFGGSKTFYHRDGSTAVPRLTSRHSALYIYSETSRMVYHEVRSKKQNDGREPMNNPLFFSPKSRRKSSALFFSLLLLFLAACSGGNSRSVSGWGYRGSGPGRFSSPRAIAVQANFVYVIDRTGRVQKFRQDGTFVLQWRLDKQEHGTPTGVSLDVEGNVWIPDTHNSRILEYNPDGQLLLSFGEYGEEPGRFVYPTDIAFGDQGELFILEYGKQDRIQVFSRSGVYLRHWGDFGSGPEQFNRPMGIARGKDGILFVSDSVNHRIKAYTQAGQLLRILGRKGNGKGEFQFPYALDADLEGNLYVCEFGNHRIQKISPDGQCLGIWGSLGSGDRQLAEPWGVAVENGKIFVADTQNHRIQVFISFSL